MLYGMGLCAGIGGLELGVRVALGPRYRCVCYVEWDSFAASVLVDRMAEKVLAPAPIWDDLQSFEGEPWYGAVDLITAGFPCQPVSAAGLKQGHEDERWLWPHIAQIIRDVDPGLVFLENVPGIVRRGLRSVWGDLRAMDFRVRAGFFSAAEVGAPHRRQRVFVLAYRDSDRLESLREQIEAFGPDQSWSDVDGRRRPWSRSLGSGGVSDSDGDEVWDESERGPGES
ncbi:MAG TPA: DNA cytosine methyltransferase, partial [Candidatus Krumholzibacterium sp.]|nr:DNA cytosine methyltransferase [Candidatus Krumholzibacterium sp.]